MPDLGEVLRGVNTGLSNILRALLQTAPGQDRTWAQVEHKLQGWRPLELQDKRLEVTLRANPCIEQEGSGDGSRRPS